MILDPPAAPVARKKERLEKCSAITGVMEERGRFPGRM